MHRVLRANVRPAIGRLSRGHAMPKQRIKVIVTAPAPIVMLPRGSLGMQPQPVNQFSPVAWPWLRNRGIHRHFPTNGKLFAFFRLELPGGVPQSNSFSFSLAMAVNVAPASSNFLSRSQTPRSRSQQTVRAQVRLVHGTRRPGEDRLFQLDRQLSIQHGRQCNQEANGLPLGCGCPQPPAVLLQQPAKTHSRGMTPSCAAAKYASRRNTGYGFKTQASATSLRVPVKPLLFRAKHRV